ncbi:phosphonate metabolism protein/1,5-bisphosphokinase (PRPP-forming) PhnN [Pararobbsia silviterrae]|uniref:Ribose 1,5-bisphosphate phosphokinase PhnN n=1 Tax=Pararobbsia silviterrae TaxID=1792498 RepID=A0A494XHY7_9BURK|nr:phosphonate metabolism protein/1,5-bisphosphokinase (PRPP-forming) PhnN [Pararobbsia silviterrae]RKP50367.1 phosphonate metabolism protein/1,5-bisphosphokinase (PRPP-forming) PhnN [Pararobbsia silviterrae]
MTGRLVYVMGPSGAGKDTLLAFARARLAGSHVMFAHRYITRAADTSGENHIHLSDEEFDTRAGLGLFALAWQSHQFRYGIGIEIDAWLASGCTVVVNGSRGHLADAIDRYPALEIVHIDAHPTVLAARLSARGRESAEQMQARLTRRVTLDIPAGVSMRTIDNSGMLEDAARALLDLLDRAG